MVLDAVANFVRGTSTESINDSQTTIPVDDASIFPDPSVQGEFNVVIWDANNFPRPDQDADVEILRVTARDTDANELTVTRAQEMTSAASHPEGSAIHLSPTAKMFSDIESTFGDFWDAGTQELTADVNNTNTTTEALEAESANIAGFGVGRVTEEIFFDQDISSVPQLSIDWGKYDEIIIALQARGAASTVPVIADFDGVQADGWDITQRDQVGTFTRTEDTDLELHSDIRNIGAGIWRIVDTQGRYLAYGNGTSFGDARWMVNASATDDSPPSNDTLDLSDTTYDRVGVWGVE